MSSYKIEEGFCATFFEHSKQTGKSFKVCATDGPKQANLPKQWNDKISSMEVVDDGDETPSGPSAKITLTGASMNKPYSRGSYKADWALQGGSKTAITAHGIGNWWKASFKGGERLVNTVRVKNRHDCCGTRIAGTKVTISGQFCATLPSAGNGVWIEVKCVRPLMGKEI